MQVVCICQMCTILKSCYFREGQLGGETIDDCVTLAGVILANPINAFSIETDKIASEIVLGLQLSTERGNSKQDESSEGQLA